MEKEGLLGLADKFLKYPFILSSSSGGWATVMGREYCWPSPYYDLEVQLMVLQMVNDGAPHNEY